MLHEVLLSLSGHPSPLLRLDGPKTNAFAGLTPSEQQLLATLAQLSDDHIKVIAQTAQISASHPSTICRGVAAAIQHQYLHRFQRKVLEVERSILKDDPDFVGVYHIVPLTAVVAEFRPWIRTMNWLHDMTQAMMAKTESGQSCTAAGIIDLLRGELQSGYRDIEEAAMILVQAAERAWIKQIAAWTLYGKLPGFGGDDFFIRRAEKAEELDEYTLDSELLPAFVPKSTASSILFIGKCLNHVRVLGAADAGLQGLDRLTSKLHELSALALPLKSAAFSRTITSIRISLSEHTLQRLLPLTKIVETLQLLRDFLLLGRGEFAMALTQEADERMRNRWQRGENLAHDRHGGALKAVNVKDGEVAAVLAKTWASLASARGEHAEEDEQIELARDLMRLQLCKTTATTPVAPGIGFTPQSMQLLTTLPFRDLLFSVPVTLNMDLPTPMDMIISPAELQIYSSINAYFLSMRRAHIRLTELWKITSLRRHHQAPRGADEDAVELRERWSARTTSLRSTWTTASAAIFFLAETEAYFQTEVVEGLWEAFHDWMIKGESRERPPPHRTQEESHAHGLGSSAASDQEDEADDLWLQTDKPGNQRSGEASSTRPHDPQSLSHAHGLYLRTLAHRLLLNQPSFTTPLHSLLVHIDYLVAHIRRLHSLFTSLDLETDAGVVNALVDLDREQAQVLAQLRAVEAKVRAGIQQVVDALRRLEADDAFMAGYGAGARVEDRAGDDDGGGGEDGSMGDLGGEGAGAFVVPRVGGVNRLLMKLDFGDWIQR